MTKSQGTIAILLLIVAIFAVGVNVMVTVSNRRPTRWEYQIVWTGNEGAESALNVVGAGGWELVSTRWAQDASDSFGYECIVRRPAR